MAWQLIYTSAPRLLEAGRTGFGTVARHRAVSGMLASSVERFSQFARLPGHDPRRTIHACRILTVGSGTYHVLSCVQDAGSDYTGRTNHIAHHLIVEPREVRALAAAGITPADVLQGMRWRTTWTDGPRYLETAEEVDLSAFKAPASRAWASITGSPASAGILWSQDVLKGCYLVTPAGVNALELFQESLLQEPAQAWQCRFTTCLEPTDDPADFRWVALPDSSPLRPQVESSSRVVLDLTTPSTLPAPPEPEPQPAGPALSPPQAALPPPAAKQKKTRKESPAPEAANIMGGWTPESRPRRAAPKAKSYIGISLLAAAVLILMVGGGLMLKFNQQKQQHLAEDEYASAIAKTWQEYDLLLDDTRKFLETQSDVKAGQDLLQSHREFFHGMRKMLNQPDAHSELPLPIENQDDLRSLSLLLKKWADLHSNPWGALRSEQGPLKAAAMNDALSRWQEARASLWRKLRAYVSLKISPPPADAQIRKLKETAKEALRSTAPEQNSRREWELLFELSEEGSAAMDPEVKKWLAAWAELDGTDSYASAQKIFADQSLPAWLRGWAAEVKPPATRMAVVPGGVSTPEKEKPKPAVLAEDADSPTATNAIFIHILQTGDDPAGKISALPVEAEMQLYVGSAWDAHPIPDSKTEPKDGELKKWALISLDGRDEIKFGPKITAAAVDTLAFSAAGSLTALPESYRKSPDGIRMVARSKDGLKVLFDLRILTSGKSNSHFFLSTLLATIASDESPALFQLINRIKFISSKQEPQFKLRAPLNLEEPWNANSHDGKCTLLPHQTSNIQNGLEITKITLQIQEINTAIKSLENHIAKLKPKQSDYAEKMQLYNSEITAKRNELAEAQGKLDELQHPKEQAKQKISQGEYTLFAIPREGVVVDICKVQIALETKSEANSKPTNP